MSAGAIEVCEGWPLGRHPVATFPDLNDGEAVVCYLLVLPELTRTSVPAPIFPPNFDPCGTIERGPMKLTGGGPHGASTVAEEMGGALFARIWLDIARAAFPGVRWRIDTVEAATQQARVAFGCLDGRVVAMFTEVLP